jgi:hypothetical protein
MVRIIAPGGGVNENRPLHHRHGEILERQLLIYDAGLRELGSGRLRHAKFEMHLYNAINAAYGPDERDFETQRGYLSRMSGLNLNEFHAGDVLVGTVAMHRHWARLQRSRWDL